MSMTLKRCSKFVKNLTKNIKKSLKNITDYFHWLEKTHKNTPLWLGGDGGGELTPLNDGDTM